MNLILCRNNAPVNHPPFWTGAHFYYTEGKIGITAQDGWTFAQQILEEGQDGEPVVMETVHWSVAALPVDEPIPPTPEQIRAAMPTLSPVQFRFLLLSIGFSGDDVNAAITAIPDPVAQEKASIYWEYATYFERLNPLIDQIGALLGLAPEQIDAAWLAFAAALEAANDA